jgi:DNA-binding LacI/PurR family transcriptional regulator
MVTQLDIARRCGLDVSSCNKILNQVPGPVFRKETIALVNRVARELGYQRRENKHELRRQLVEVEAALADLWKVVTTAGTPPIGGRRLQEIEQLVLRGKERGQVPAKKKAKATA